MKQSPNNLKHALDRFLQQINGQAKCSDEQLLLIYEAALSHTQPPASVIDSDAGVDDKFHDLAGAISRLKNKYIDDGDAKTTGADMHDVILAARLYIQPQPAQDTIVHGGKIEERLNEIRNNQPAPSVNDLDAGTDWTEDLTHENGNYQCLCILCNKYFQGHKRRVVCKRCAYPTRPEIDLSGLMAGTHKIVPIEPTYNMCAKGCRTEHDMDFVYDMYQRMLSAAPSNDGVK